MHDSPRQYPRLVRDSGSGSAAALCDSESGYYSPQHTRVEVSSKCARRTPPISYAFDYAFFCDIPAYAECHRQRKQLSLTMEVKTYERNGGRVAEQQRSTLARCPSVVFSVPQLDS